MSVLPLSGIRVLTFEAFGAGPYGSMFLADLGAEVIKIEPPGGERTRRLKGFGTGYFSYFNRNKKSLEIDYKTESGLADTRALIASADVLIENMAPHALERAGLGPEDAKKLNPDLIVEFVDPREDPKRANSAGLRSPNELVIEHNRRREHLPLAEFNEQNFANTLLRLSRTSAALIYALDGHGERKFDGQANHDLGELMFIALTAALANADSWADVERFGTSHQDWFAKHLPLENGIPSHDTFSRVFARLDSGGLVILDYKTGVLPKEEHVALGLSPQLPLEALIAEAGGFENVEAGKVEALEYWRLSGADPAGEIKSLADGDPRALIEAARAGLLALIAKFADPATPYLSRPDPVSGPRYSDYDHLARVKEWSTLEG